FGRVQESGRIATEMVARDIRMADYWGCARTTASITDNLDATQFSAELNPTGAPGVEVQDNVATGTEFGSVTVKGGTDTLTLRSSRSIPAAKITHAMATTAATIRLQVGANIPRGTV